MQCPSCKQENPHGFRFCGACGTALADVLAPIREERKVVTVLFADLVGFTSRAEKMDPEDVRALLAPYHARLREELGRLGGTVEKFVGDAVMALFGAPVAHEDDPERAVRAALAIRDWVSEDETLQLRIAINTGEALIVLGARPEAGEAMASGDVVNTAARLQSAAPVNGILVGETTYRATRQVIDYREAHAVDAKGKAEPVRVWEAVTPRSRVGVDVVQSTRAPLVGRDRELGLLVDTANRVRDSREPQLVTLLGVPGIGKSRLTYELFRALDQQSDPWRWRQGRCLPYGESVTFWPVGEIVKSHAEIFETDTSRRAREKLHRLVVQVGGNPSDAAHLEEQLLPLVGAASDTSGRVSDHAVAYAAWRRLFEALADEAPLVLVVEDLHWADDPMLEFVDYLVDWATDAPILVLGTSRPELLDRRPDWGGGKANATTISLAPLTDQETAQLLSALLQRPVAEAEAQRTLLERAGGNPLYAEQYAQMYVDRGDADDAGPPETIQGLIAARIDALVPAEKQLLQDASVHGKVFWAGALDRDGSAAEALHALERKEFVRRQRRSSVAAETEYAFRHMLVRDVAYSQIPRAVRAEKHVGAAAWIEALVADRDDHVEVLANHYALALELAHSARIPMPDIEPRAQLAFSNAGRRALELGAYASAETHFRRALELTPEGAVGRGAVLLGLGDALAQQARGGIPELVEASALLSAVGETSKAADAEATIAAAMVFDAQMDRALEHSNRAVELVRDAPDSREKLVAFSQDAFNRLLVGDFREGIERTEETIRLAQRLDDRAEVASAIALRGMTRLDLGMAEGLADVEHAVALARALPPVHASPVLANAGVTLLEVDGVDRAAELFEEAEAAAFEAADVAHLDRIAVMRGRERYYRGEWDEALLVFDQSIADTPQTFAGHELRPRTMRALIRIARDNALGATDDAERAVVIAQTAREPQALHTALAVRAYVALLTGDVRVSRASARDLLALIASDGTQQVSMSLGILAEVVTAHDLEKEFHAAIAAIPKAAPWKDAANAIVADDAATAADIYREIGSRPDEARANLLAARAAVAEADDRLRAALTFYRSVGAARYVREAERLFPTGGPTDAEARIQERPSSG